VEKSPHPHAKLPQILEIMFVGQMKEIQNLGQI
jgi:hypothetical protein